MDNVVAGKIKKFLENVNLMYSLVKSYYAGDHTAEEIISVLKMQHSANQALLSDLGYTPDHTVRIRELNEHVRTLEDRLGRQDDIGLEAIGRYMSVKTQDFREMLEKEGISANVCLEVSDYLDVKISIYSQQKLVSASDHLYCNNEEELAELQRKRTEKFEAFTSGFDTQFTDKWGGERHYLLYTDKNVARITDLCNTFFDTQIMNPEFELMTLNSALHIREFKFVIACTQQARNLHAAFASFNDRL